MLRNLAWVLASLILLVAAGGFAIWWYMLGVPGQGHQGPLPPATNEELVLANKLKTHVVAIASTPHNIDYYENLERAAEYLEEQLSQLGYQVTQQEFVASGLNVRNLEVTIPATADATGKRSFVIGAHYDSAFYAPGANDNGTGTAAVLELARLLKNNKSKDTTIRLVLFVNEEPPFFGGPLMGSSVYAASLKARGEQVIGMISLETLGAFYDTPNSQKYPQPLGLAFPTTANFVAFVGMPKSRAFVHEVMDSFRRHTAFPSIGGVAPSYIQGIAWSDHASFQERGFPALMITDTAVFRYPHYHKATDTPDKVDYEKLARITKGVERVVRDLVK